ncbi:MAG: WGR domain-containing protein, partial [Massilia sp.]
MRRFEFNEGVSSKFWEIEQIACDVHVRFGKIGTAGQAQVKSHPDETTAGAALAKLVKEKTGKGYAEVGASAAAVPAAAPKAPKAATPPTPVKQAPVEPAPAITAASVAAQPAPLSGEIAPWLATGPVLEMAPKMLQLAMPSRRFPGTAATRD